MSLQGRIAELTHRHQTLDSKIHDEMKRPVADSLQLRQLKQEKLRIKQELMELKKPN